MKPFIERFIREYIACGYIGQRAYLKLRPHVKPKTAQVEASKLLSLPIVQEELKRLTQKTYDNSIASREYLIQEAHETIQEAKKEKAYGVIMKGIELKGKLARLFEKDTPDIEAYTQVIQQFVVNVTPADNDKDKVIDIEAGDEGRD